MAAATVVSPRMSPQEATPRLVVRLVEVLVWCWVMTWKRAEATSAGRGR